MANRYWVGGSGTWDTSDTTHWSTSTGGAGGASVPTSADPAIFDSASNATAYTVTVGVTVVCLDITTAAPTSGNMTVSGTGTIQCYGNFSFYNGLILSSYLNVEMKATSTGKTVTTNGRLFGGFTFNGIGGGWTLQDNLSWGYTTNLYAGALDLNGKTVAGQSFNALSGSTRSLVFNGAIMNLNTPYYTTDFSGSGLTLTQDTGVINLSGNTAYATPMYFKGGGLTFTNVTVAGSYWQIQGTNTFTNLTATMNITSLPRLEFAANQTVTGTLTLNGDTVTFVRGLFCSDVKGVSRTITAATVASSYSDFMDITGAGAGNWNLSAITGLSGDCQGNSGITFTTPSTQYWKHGATASTYCSVSANWYLATNGGGGAGHIPLPQDVARFDSNSFAASGKTVTFDVARFGSLDCTGATNTPTIALTYSTNYCFGSVTLISGITFSCSQILYMWGRGSYTITCAGKSLGGNTFFGSYDNSVLNPTYTLQDDYTSVSTTVYSGTFNANNHNTLSTNYFAYSNYATITMGSGTWEISGATGSFGSSNIGSCVVNYNTSTVKFTGTNGTKNFYGAGKTFYNVWNASTGAGALIISGSNTINDFKPDPGTTNNFTGGTTQTVASITSTPGSVATLQSTSGGSYWSLSKASGGISVDYLSIQDSHAGGGASYLAGPNSLNVSGNTGWVFQPKSNFFMMFK